MQYGINRATVEFAISTHTAFFEELGELQKDYEYKLACMNPTRRYAVTHEAPEPQKPTKSMAIVVKSSTMTKPSHSISRKAKRKLRKRISND